MAQQEKKDRMIISVRTVPNGYTLDIEAGGKKNGFMYFNPYKLLDGFMYHVGLVELGEVSEEFRTEVMKAALAWQDNGKLVKLNLRYETKIKELKKRVETLEKELGKKKPKADDDVTPKRYRGKSKPKEKVGKLIASKSAL